MKTVTNQTLNDVRLKFAQDLSLALKAQKISKKDLANEIDVSPNTIRNVLKGENFNFNVAVKVDLAMNLGYFTSDQSAMKDSEQTSATVENSLTSLLSEETTV